MRERCRVNPAPTFDRVYVALKALIASGRFIPGDRLDFVALGEALQVSITPVRDALYRLMGEGLVVAGQPDGFAMPPMLEADLRDLYAWTRELLLLGLRLTPPDRSGWQEVDALTGFESENSARAVAALFTFVVEQAGNTEHLGAIGRANDRLAAVRSIEADIVADAPADIVALLAAVRSGSTGMIRRQVIAYHRKRLRAVRELVPALSRRDGSSRRG